MPRRSPWTLEIVLARRFRLEALLIDLGDEKYLRERAAAFYTERHGRGVRWGTMYPRQVPPILAGSRSGRRPGPEDVDLTRRMLQQLVAAKQFDDVPVRNRNELTLRALRIIAPVVLLASVAFAVAIADVVPDDRVLQLAAAAGAIGAALGTLIRVRDDLIPGSQIREFVPFFISQVTVGATAGMLAFLVDRSGIVAVGGDASGLAAVAFALGFTEAAFLRLIARVANLAGGGAGAAPSVPTDPPRRARTSDPGRPPGSGGLSGRPEIIADGASSVTRIGRYGLPRGGRAPRPFRTAAQRRHSSSGFSRPEHHQRPRALH